MNFYREYNQRGRGGLDSGVKIRGEGRGGNSRVRKGSDRTRGGRSKDFVVPSRYEPPRVRMM